jgi:hypothetical protein
MPIVPPEQLPAAVAAHVIPDEGEDRHAPHPAKELLVEVKQLPVINQSFDSMGNVQGGVIPPPSIKFVARNPL